MSEYKHLSKTFLEAMDSIGRHGFAKHGENSFQARLLKGDLSRTFPRHTTAEIMKHARDHTHAYEQGVRHDHFGDQLHQLAAVAFNAMIEAQFARLTDDPLPFGEEEKQFVLLFHKLNSDQKQCLLYIMQTMTGQNDLNSTPV